MMMKTIAMALVALTLGCGKKKGGDDDDDAKGKLPESITSWTPANAATAWAGAWTGRMTLEMGGTHSMAGDHAAFDIQDKKAIVFDGKKEHELKFRIETPCAARFDQALTEGSMAGGTAYHHIAFAVGKDGKAILGDGDVGYRKGKAAVFCLSGMEDGVYLLDEAGTCTKWKRRFRDWEDSKTTCTWSTADGKEILTVGAGQWAPKLYADGDLVMSEQFKDSIKWYARATDFATAKTEVTARMKGDDPGEQAKLAGGKVGDLSTILGLNATWAVDKSIKGKKIELRAQFLNSNHSVSGDKHYYSGELVDSKDLTKFTLSCQTATEVPTFTQYDPVIATGTLDESFNRPSLKDCTLTKAP